MRDGGTEGKVHGMACMHVGFYVLRKVGALGKVMVWLQRPHVVQISPQMLEMWMDGWNGCLLGISCDTDYCDGWVGRLEVDLLESVA